MAIIENKEKRKKCGLLMLFLILILFFLLILPFNLSVKLSSLNEGYDLIIGKYFLDGEIVKSFAKPLLISVYALIVKVFGFGTPSIIALHFVQTFVSITIAIVIFLISLKVLKHYSYAVISSLVWLLLLITPIGGWETSYEIGSIFALEAEYFCVLFSLLSIYFFLLSLSFHANKKKLFAYFAGIFACISFIFKGSGVVIVLSYCLWYLIIFLTKRKIHRRLNFAYLLFGLLTGITITILTVFFQGENVYLFFKDLFYPGSYTTSHLSSSGEIFKYLIMFMFRFDSSFKGVNNFILFLVFFISILWPFLDNKSSENNKLLSSTFSKLIAIWAALNILAVVAPGMYVSYYYLLLWPGAAILLTLLLKGLLQLASKNVILKILIIVFVFVLFIQRIYFVIPSYEKLFVESYYLNAFIQKKSFQDPVLTDKQNQYFRPADLRIADYINRLLPNKRHTFYILNFVEKNYSFSSNMYVYAKRMPPTTIAADLLHLYQNIYFLDKINILKNDLKRRPPKIIIKPKQLYMDEYHKGYSHIQDLFYWFDIFLKENYQLINEIRYIAPRIGIDQPMEIYKRVGEH